MAAPTIAEMLKYANLQMAAEALYNFNAKLFGASLTPGDISSSAGHYTGAIDPQILTYGNRFGSRFTQVQADDFVKQPKGSETFGFLNQSTNHAPLPPFGAVDEMTNDTKHHQPSQEQALQRNIRSTGQGSTVRAVAAISPLSVRCRTENSAIKVEIDHMSLWP